MISQLAAAAAAGRHVTSRQVRCRRLMTEVSCVLTVSRLAEPLTDYNIHCSHYTREHDCTGCIVELYNVVVQVCRKAICHDLSDCGLSVINEI